MRPHTRALRDAILHFRQHAAALRSDSAKHDDAVDRLGELIFRSRAKFVLAAEALGVAPVPRIRKAPRSGRDLPPVDPAVAAQANLIWAQANCGACDGLKDVRAQGRPFCGECYRHLSMPTKQRLIASKKPERRVAALRMAMAEFAKMADEVK